MINPWVNAYGFGTLPAVAPDQRLLNVSNLTNNGISNYNGITASLSQRVKWGLQFRFNYTYGHTSDHRSRTAACGHTASKTADAPSTRAVRRKGAGKPALFF